MQGENSFNMITEKNIDPADEIVVHLPARHLQILKSVCKDWLHLIASDYFVRRHLSKSKANRIRVVLTFPCTKDDYLDPNAHTMTDYYENTLVKIPYPPQFSKTTTSIAGSADGLICLLDKTMCKTAVFNPSTGKYFTSKLRRKEYGLVFWWFGKYNNPLAGEYVLVLGTRTRPRVEFEVFKFGRNYMNRIQSVLVDRLANDQPADVFPLDQRGTLVQGVVHWPIKHYLNVNRRPNRLKILAYHIDSNTHSEIPAPVQREFRLGEGIAGGGLFATLQNYEERVFEVWVMKEEYSGWTKYGNIHIEGFRVLSPLGFFPNGDMLLDDNKSKLIRYNFNHNQEILLKEYDGPRNEAIMCADSLVSP